MNRHWNWEGAELSLNKAIELEPGSAAVLRFRSFLCQSLGQLNEAIEFYKQAIALDPLLAGSHSYLAILYYAAGKYDNAETEAQQALASYIAKQQQAIDQRDESRKVRLLGQH